MEKYDDVHVYSTKETIPDDHYFRVLNIRAIGLTFAFTKDGFAHTMYETTHLSRLDNIHQYGWFHGNPHHSRMNHMLVCYGFAQLIGSYLNLTPHEKRVLYFSALTHDVTTPALGDRVKHLAKQEFDEEITYGDWIQRSEVRRILRDLDTSGHVICAHDCIDAVQGKNNVGKLLDWIDKIAYTYFDLDMIEHEHTEIHERIQRRLKMYCDKFEKTSLGKMGIDDLRKKGHRLHISLARDHSGATACAEVPVFVCFAAMRAALFEEVCFSARSNGIADWYAHIVIPYLIHQRLLTVEDLLGRDDNRVKHLINQYFESDTIVTHHNATWEEWWFDNREDAEKKVANEMEKEGVTAFLMKSNDYGKTCASMVYRMGVHMNGHIGGLRDNDLRLPFIRKAEEYNIIRRFHVVSIQRVPYSLQKIEALKNFHQK